MTETVLTSKLDCQVVSKAGGFFRQSDRDHISPDLQNRMVSECADLVDQMNKDESYRNMGEINNLVLANYHSFNGTEQNKMTSE